jgi:hypothetical protein
VSSAIAALADLLSEPVSSAGHTQQQILTWHAGMPQRAIQCQPEKLKHISS